MEIRNAKITDVPTIHQLINYYAELDRMLFRDKAEIYENLQTFAVAVDNNQVVGCCSLQIIWHDLAEIKSLAVSNDCKSKGVGRALVNAALETAAKLCVGRVFALTLECGFFEKLGFEKLDKDSLPMKVWRDCAKCAKQQNCDEFAYIKTIRL